MIKADKGKDNSAILVIVFCSFTRVVPGVVPGVVLKVVLETYPPCGSLSPHLSALFWTPRPHDVEHCRETHKTRI